MIKVACDGQEVTLRCEESSKAREIKEAAEAEGNVEERPDEIENLNYLFFQLSNSAS
jgi:hypothetical protein